MYAPNIFINSPDSDQPIGRDAPTFDVDFIDISLNTTWYSLYNGESWTANKTFSGNNEINQTIWESVWDSVSHGDSITIRFYANDSLGRVNYADVEVIKNDPTSSGGSDLMIFIIIGILVIGAIIGIIVIVLRKSSYKSTRKEADKIKDIMNTI